MYPGRLLGPHNDIELELMLAGNKYAALLMPQERYLRFLPYVETGTFVWAMIRNAGRVVDSWSWCHMFVPAGHEWRIIAVAAIYERVRKRNIMDHQDHYLIGKLLDYTDEEISAFLESKT